MTAHHAFTGAVDVSGQRLSEHLGNVMVSVLRMQEVTVARLGDPETVVARHDEVHIPGPQIVAAFEMEPPVRGRSEQVIRKYPHRVHLVAEHIEITGHVHALSETALDIKQMLTVHGDRFLPVTQAEVFVGLERGHRLRLEAVLVNARRLHAMARPDAIPGAPR